MSSHKSSTELACSTKVVIMEDNFVLRGLEGTVVKYIIIFSESHTFHPVAERKISLS